MSSVLGDENRRRRRFYESGVQLGRARSDQREAFGGGPDEAVARQRSARVSWPGISLFGFDKGEVRLQDKGLPSASRLGLRSVSCHRSPMSMMSLSPTTSTSNYDDQPSGKRRRTTSFTAAANGGGRSEMASPQDPPSGHGLPSSVPSAHIPKRGARACTNCRKGKNRCEGEVRTLRPVRSLSPDADSPRLPAHPPRPGVFRRPLVAAAS